MPNWPQVQGKEEGSTWGLKSRILKKSNFCKASGKVGQHEERLLDAAEYVTMDKRQGHLEANEDARATASCRTAAQDIHF
jgi:hypothetical protein